MADGIGLSIGSAHLTAVHVGRAAVRRSAVLTRYPHRPPEVGVPSENPKLAERGLILTDFVDRVGDPVPMVAPDGSSHRAEVVLVDSLRAVLLTLFGGRPVAEPVGVAYPAHWRPAAVDALRGVLATVPEFRTPLPALLVSDATAALTALQQDPGVPARGVIAVCDFGASGTSVTLADAANGFQPIGPTVRNDDLSGELIDQALLTRVVSGLAAGGSVDVTGTSAIGSLGRLRAECRAAKERLSTTTVTSLPVDVPGAGGEVRLTRAELDDAIRAPLDDFVADLREALQRSGIRAGDLVAVASVGGGARIPIVTTTLSEHLRVPVISAPAPELAPAIGSGLRAIRSTVQESATSMAPVLPVPPVAAEVPVAAEAPLSGTVQALAWSDADDVPDVAPPSEDVAAASYDDVQDPVEAARPSLAFDDPEPGEPDRVAVVPWYRRPVAIVVGAVVLVLAILGVAAAVILTGDEESTEPVPTTTASVPPPPSGEPTAPPADQAPPVDQGSAPEQAPAPETQTVTEQAPPPPPPESAPPPASEPPPAAPAPSSEAPPPSTEAPPPASAPPSSQPPVITPPYTTVPGLPFVPAPPAIPGLLQPATP